MPTISVVMPAFNAETYISDAIESILKQTYQDFELIIINDGSTDRTLDIIKQYSDARIILINNDKNIGFVNSLNIGLSVSNGIFVARMDADDISELERFEIQLHYCEKYKLDLCGCHWVCIDQFGDTYDSNLAPINEIDLLFRFANGSPFAHGSVMIRRSFMLRHVLKYEQQYAEDFLLWFNMHELGAKIGAVDKFLFKYRTLQGSLSNRMKKEYRHDAYKIRSIFIDFNKKKLIHSLQNFDFTCGKITPRNFEADFVFCLLYLRKYFKLVELVSLLIRVSLISILRGFRRYFLFKF